MSGTNNQCALLDGPGCNLLGRCAYQLPGTGSCFQELGEAQILLANHTCVERLFGTRRPTQRQGVAAVGGATVADGISNNIKAGVQFQGVAATAEVNCMSPDGMGHIKAARDRPAVDDEVVTGSDNTHATR